MKKYIVIFTALIFYKVCIGQMAYYVSTEGSDSNVGTLLAPWYTIQYGLNQLSANDTLYVDYGLYFEKISIPIDNIYLKNYATSTVIIDGTGNTLQDAIININNRSNVTIDGFELKNNIQNDAQGILIDGSGDNIVIKNCSIHGIHFSGDANAQVNENTNAQGIIVYGTNSTNPITNLKLINNHVFDCRLGYSEGIAINGNVDGFEITDCKVYDLTNIGIVLIGHEGTCPNAANDQARNGLVKNNVAYYCISPYATSAGIYVDGAKNITIEKNTSYHNGFGIEIGCENIGKIADQIVAKNNILYDNQISAIALGGFDYPTGSGKVTNSTVRNNTCFYNDYSNSGNGEFYLSYSENCTVENNIFYTTDQNIAGNASLSQPELEFNYNNFYCQAGAEQLTTYWNNSEYNGFLNFTNNTNTNTNSIFANPQLSQANIINPEFMLLENSPCINAGNPFTIIDVSETSFFNEARVAGGIVDIGADEVGSTSGIYSTERLAYSIYPNPSNGLITIACAKPISWCKIYNTIGKLEIKNMNSNTIDVSNLNAGLYVLMIEIENKICLKQFVKN